MSEDRGSPGGSSKQDSRSAGSFEERLKAARHKQGLDAPPKASGPGGDGAPSPMGVGLRVGVEMVSAMVVAVAIGWYLDHWLHSSPAFLVVFVLLGGAAGVANVWRLMGPRRPPKQD